MNKAGFFGLIALAIFAVIFYEEGVSTPNAGEGEAVVEIRKGESVKTIATALEKAGVISSPALFRLESRLAGTSGKLRAGEYLLRRDQSIRQTILALVEGKSMLRKITIPEGLSVRQIAQLLEKEGVASAKDFEQAAMNPELLKKHNVPAVSAEGYLFPDTYHFVKNTSAGMVAGVMVETFFEKIPTALPETVWKDPEKLHKTLTLASIIEKETGADAERSMVAAVFMNRLEMGMPLQSDPTVIYAIPDFDGDIRKKDLRHDSPYNTYTRRGLPPGPIANPGLASLQAVLNPAPGGYLYFVSKNDGTHKFSETLDEHNSAVRKYQLAK
ncbi:MAG: endolytic transglycosylase MltG [Nitrospinae bacterium]|nr:endolytic transglycosylase MltG [Nitrospinota bacterium]